MVGNATKVERALQFAVAASAFVAMAALAKPTPPVATTMVRPAYPHEAQRAGIQGCAILRFDVAPSGAPENVHVVRSAPYAEFGASARTALEQWRFQPFAANGTAATFHGATQAFLFALPDHGKPPACGQGTAVAAVVGNAALPPRPPPAAPAPAQPVAAAPVHPRAPPATVVLNLTRPAVVESYAAGPNGEHVPAGRVTIRFCVNARGRTERLRVVRSRPQGTFDDAALSILRAAEFKPYEVDGEPAVACGITQTIIFEPEASRG